MATSHRAPRRNDRARIAVAVVVVIVLGTFAYRTWWTSGSSAPYRSSAVNAHVKFSVVVPGKAQAAADKLAGPGRLIAPSVTVDQTTGNSLQEVVGQLTLTVPKNAPSEGEYGLFVLDTASGKPAVFMAGVGPLGSQVAAGWNGIYNKVAKKYGWLKGLASIKLADGSGDTFPGMNVSFPPNTPGPISFVAQLDASAPTIKDARNDITIALVFVGEDGTIHWAEQVPS